MSETAIGDWTALEVGRLYELRSGPDRQRATFMGGLTDHGAQFELEGTGIQQTFASADWDVYPL